MVRDATRSAGPAVRRYSAAPFLDVPGAGLRAALEGRLAALAYGLKEPAGVTIHSVRHTCSTWLAQAGVQDHLMAGILGHSTGNMTARYTPMDFDHKLEVVQSKVSVSGRSAAW